MLLSSLTEKNINPVIAGKFRKGDVRHCFADISKIMHKLEFEPQVSLNNGLKELIGWSANESAEDRVEHATEELAQKGLLK